MAPVAGAGDAIFSAASVCLVQTAKKLRKNRFWIEWDHKSWLAAFIVPTFHGASLGASARFSAAANMSTTNPAST